MALRIHIRFRRSDYTRWLRATAKIQAEALRESLNLPYRMAVGYTNLVRSNISTGKFTAMYAPYSERYYHWKYFIFGSSGGFWYLKGHLLRSLTTFRHENGWMGGIPAGIQVEGSSWFGEGQTGRPAYVAEYGNWMEFGRGRQPARPLFTPTLKEYRENEALKEAVVSLNKVASRWN